MKLWVGTSGWSYKEWKGSFYPEDIAPSDMLGHYASRLPTVEINNTFYRMPKASVLARWAETVPDGEAALAAAERSRFDLVLLDLSMPGIGGLEVLDRLRASSCDAEIVVLTAHGSVEKAVEGEERLGTSRVELREVHE